MTKSRINSEGPGSRTGTPNFAAFKLGTPLAQKKTVAPSILTLKKVIGTTTESPHGLSCNYESQQFVTCAGAVAVLHKIGVNGIVSQRFFRARPNAAPFNPSTSFYNSSPSASPDTRRKSIIPFKIPGLSQAITPKHNAVDGGTSGPWTARERVKTCSCVSLSPDGRLLAVGESGYSPRVLVFSTDEDASHERPLSIINEHTFGVRSIAFSPDSRYLATLGDVNDGFLFIWSVNTRTGSVRLHSTNKCTTNICQMLWCGSTLVTAGTRHIKTWRIKEIPPSSPTKSSRFRLQGEAPASPSPQTLSGRNCLLGPLVDSTFTCAAYISEEEVVVCSDKGHLCLLNLGDHNQDLRYCWTLSRPVQCVDVDVSLGIVRTGTGSSQATSSCETVRIAAKTSKWPDSHASSSPSLPRSPTTTSPQPSLGESRSIQSSIVASASVAGYAIAIDSNRSIEIQSTVLQTDGYAIRAEGQPGAVGGVERAPAAMKGDASFYSWTPNGHINFWDSEGHLTHSRRIDVEQNALDAYDTMNAISAVRISPQGDFIACGDKFGILKMIHIETWAVLAEVRAHGAEITDVAICNGEHTLVASSSRDRTLQLFRKTDQSFELLQTVNDHVGAINHVRFTSNSTKLVSASADRTVIVREIVSRSDSSELAAVASKIVTLKASPTAICAADQESNSINVSTMDRSVLRIDLKSGNQSELFKSIETDGEDAVILSNIVQSHHASELNEALIVASSSADKSIRVYDPADGVLLAKECGHTEGMSGLLLLSDAAAASVTVVSAGLDGIIMMWSLDNRRRLQQLSTPLQEIGQGQACPIDTEGTPRRDSVVTRPLMRKLLSKSDIADFMQSDTAVLSPTPLREPSPTRLLQRKHSTQTLSISKVSLANSPSILPPKRTLTGFDRHTHCRNDRISSPSPPPAVTPSAVARDVAASNQRLRSPSPSSVPSPTTRSPQKANKTRLRRPPSIPSNLRSHSSAVSRRKSISSVQHSSDATSLSNASESLSKMLRSYRRRLDRESSGNNPSLPAQLEEVEVELLATLTSIRNSKSKQGGNEPQGRIQAATESELDELASLVKGTSLEATAAAERSE